MRWAREVARVGLGSPWHLVAEHVDARRFRAVCGKVGTWSAITHDPGASGRRCPDCGEEE